jgi:hypothetical protein
LQPESSVSTKPVSKSLLKRLAATAVLALAIPATHAADADGRFAVKSVGGTKCSQFVEAMKTKNQGQIALYVGWIAGFISASNQLQESTFDLAAWQDMRTLTALLHRHCDRNADLRFGAAVAQMANAMKTDRLQARSEVVQLDHDGKAVQVYQEALRRAQSALAELGMYSGDLDGQLNDSMREALKKFQGENKINVSGVPDQATLFALFATARKARQQ